ncbi:Retrovirus-related Pol polyprotein from transposon RE2 [Sesamum angolense]|uniref:Retrovirus-related Pol polyprotein from transposon RE2 n=1 Tax=Sesamum angolense TaxID=2727404 RepID=A0AAE1T5E2_9LAMI|nr:Retrovirus-related Pol polyprotein from transposon RE2 [Sesamum angolense]
MKRLVDSKSLEIDNLDNLPACQRGLSYFITFTDDHSRYDYIYLMRYKSEVFVRFKEFKLEVENQTGRKIKALRTPPGTLQLNGVAESRNRTLLDTIQSVMSFTKLPLSLWGYALETVASPACVKRLVGDKLRSSLRMFIGYPKQTGGYYFYDSSEQKVFVSRNVVFLERGFPTDTRRDELLLKESGEAPQSNAGTSSAPIVSTNNVPILRRSARVPQPPERYGFLGDNLQGLVAKGYTERPGVDFKKTFSPIAMAKSIRFIAIAAWYDYEIWQMDVKMALLHGFIEDEIYMDQPKEFTIVGEDQRACHLERSIYGLKYMRTTKDVFLVYGGGELILEGFSDASFQREDDYAKSQSGFVFKLNGGVVAWKSSKQDTTVDSTMEAEYIAAKEAVWMKNNIQELGVVPSIAEPVVSSDKK